MKSFYNALTLVISASLAIPFLVAAAHMVWGY